jgi:hypothetical protein
MVKRERVSGGVGWCRAAEGIYWLSKIREIRSRFGIDGHMGSMGGSFPLLLGLWFRRRWFGVVLVGYIVVVLGFF